MKKHNKIILKGTPASSGFVKGIVKIVTKPDQNSHVSLGNILVTSITNPLLTPAILKAGAIITDIGGVLSHPAMIARELGIPAIVDTGNASQILTNNMMVTVDGDKGLIYVES